MNLGNTTPAAAPNGLRVTQAVETYESGICLYLAGILLRDRKYTSEWVRVGASILLEKRHLPVSVGFLEPLAADGVTQPLPFGGDSENFFLNGLSAEERANHAIHYLVSRLAAEMRVCKRVRLQVLNKFTQPMNRGKEFTNHDKLRVLVRDMCFDLSRKRLDCGCAKCVRDEVPNTEDPERQLFVLGHLYLDPISHRHLSASERKRLVDLAVALLIKRFALSSSKLEANRVKINKQINLRDRLGRLASEAAAHHYCGDFAAQAVAESKLSPLMDALDDFRVEQRDLYDCVFNALYQVGDGRAATRADMLAGFSLCFANRVPAEVA